MSAPCGRVRSSPRDTPPNHWNLAASPQVGAPAAAMLLIAVTAVLMTGMLAGLAALGVWRDAQRASSNGWIAVSANPRDVIGGESGDIYLLDGAAAPRRIIGADDDGLAQACPRFSPDGARLAYGEAHAGARATNNMRRFWLVTHRALVVVRLDSHGAVSGPLVRVTLPPEEQSDMPCPEWSPDGRSIAFRDRQTLWVADAESGETVAFDLTASGTQERGSFAWSRDGSHIAVGQPGEIRVLRVDDGTSRVVKVEGGTPESVSWTRGDATIAYVATDSAGGAAFSEGRAVHIVGADGRNDRQLTPDSPDSRTQLNFYGAVASPSGTRVAYVGQSSRCTTVSLADGDGSQRSCARSVRLVTVDFDGSNSVELPLSEDVFMPAMALEDRFGLQWSPDGRRLLLSSIAGVVSVAAASSSPPVVHARGDQLNLEWSSYRIAWQPVATGAR